MSDDLQELLLQELQRRLLLWSSTVGVDPGVAELTGKAHDEIERLSAEIERLRAELERRSARYVGLADAVEHLRGLIVDWADAEDDNKGVALEEMPADEYFNARAALRKAVGR